MIRRRIASSGRMEHHFMAFNDISLLTCEVKYIGIATKLNSVAQVIPQGDGKSLPHHVNVLC